MEKERRTKALLLSTLVVVVATVSIAFAAMSRTLNINGIGKMDTATWSVYFDNLSDANIVRGALEVGKPKISDDKGIVQDINVKLSNPKDEISYTVDIVNDGTIDAEITMIKDIELTDVQKKVFEFKVTYTDTGEILQNGDILPKDTTKNITINIKFKDDITEFDLPTESQTISLSYQLTYTQYDGSDIVIEPDGGDITTGKAVLARGLTLDELFELDGSTPVPFFNGTIGRGSVESINFVNNTNVPTEVQATVWDASEDKDNSIIGWYQDTDSNGLNEVYIGSNANIYAPSDSSGLFAGFVSLKEIIFNNFNTSDVTNMSYMFYYNEVLLSLDLSTFDTSNVTDMSCMFNGYISMVNLNLSSFNTSNVTNMSAMFSLCTSLINLDLSSFNTSKVTDMSYIFDECPSLISLDLSNFNTSKVTNMSGMFLGCEVLENLNLNNWDTSNVTDMSEMFSACESLTNLDLSSFDTSNVTTMKMMFYSCKNLMKLDLKNADFSGVSEYYDMFAADAYSVLTSQIIVKDETQRTWITSRFPDLTNVVLPSEL